MDVFHYLFEHGVSRDIAVVHDAGDVSYGQLYDSAVALRKVLMEDGLERGHHVAVVGANSPFWIQSYLGVLAAGCVVVPLLPQTPRGQLSVLLRWLGCSIVLVQADRLTEEIRDLDAQIVFVEDGACVGGVRRLSFRKRAVTVVTETSQDGLAALMLTSGSTVEPKAVMTSHRNIIANTEAIIEALQIQREQRMLCVMPFAYCFSTSLLHTHLRAGGSLSLYSGAFAPARALETLSSTRCTSLAGIPSVFQIALRTRSFAAHPTPTLKFIQQAGGRLAPVFIQALLEALPQARIHIMYGQTEATARLTALPPARLAEKMDSVGLAIEGVNVTVVRADGTECAVRETGAIMVAGDNIAMGYWRDPLATAARFRDGRLYTGDVGFRDHDGYLYIVDREEDFIKAAGHRFSARVVEDCIAAIADVVEVAVVGVPHRTLGEAAKAYVVLKPGAVLTQGIVARHCRAALPHYMAPRQIVVVGELPRNAAGKVLKSTLRRLG